MPRLHCVPLHLWVLLLCILATQRAAAQTPDGGDLTVVWDSAGVLQL